MYKRILMPLLLSFFILPHLAFAGAWTIPKNHFWAEYSMKGIWAKKDFGSDDLHRFPRDARSWGWSTNPKAEYGLTDWMTILGGLEYKESHYKEYDRPSAWGSYAVKSHSLTSVDFGSRIRLLKAPFILSGQIKASIYTNDGKNRVPQLSDGNDSLEFRTLIGKTFDTKIPFYLGGEAGYRFNNRGVANVTPLFVEGGFWPLNWLLIKSEIDGIWSHDGTGNLEKSYAIWRIGPVFQLMDLYKKCSGKTINSKSSITRSDTSLNVEIQYGNTFWGRNTSAAQEVILKISAQI